MRVNRRWIAQKLGITVQRLIVILAEAPAEMVFRVSRGRAAYYEYDADGISAWLAERGYPMPAAASGATVESVSGAPGEGGEAPRMELRLENGETIIVPSTVDLSASSPERLEELISAGESMLAAGMSGVGFETSNGPVPPGIVGAILASASGRRKERVVCGPGSGGAPAGPENFGIRITIKGA